MGQYRTIRDWTLEKQIVNVEQDLLALKTQQRYLTGQAQGFLSNRLRVDSWVAFVQGGYEYREIFAEFTVRGSFNGALIPTLKIQLYDSSGNPIKYGAGMWNNNINLLYFQDRVENEPNEHTFLVNLYLVKQGQGSTDAFYGEFWVVANDDSIISLKGTHIST